MQCPRCTRDETRVVDSREPAPGTVRRRRECTACEHRWTTYERPATVREYGQVTRALAPLVVREELAAIAAELAQQHARVEALLRYLTESDEAED